jgi:hypothetical protein
MSRHLTTAKRQVEQTKTWKAKRDNGEPFFAFFLSYDGYVRLRVPEAGSTLPPPETGVGLLFMCYAQKLIQFAIQQDGADGNDFVMTGVGADAVPGRNTTRLAQQ